MKKLILIVLIILGLMVTAYAGPSILSGEKTSSALIYTKVEGTTCLIKAVKVVTNGSDDGKIIVYDGTDATGTVIDETTATGSDHWGGRTWPDGGIMETGIYIAVSGTGASYFVEYELK